MQFYNSLCKWLKVFSIRVIERSRSHIPIYVLFIPGDNHRSIKVGEVCTPIGTLLVAVVYRTKMSIIPEDGRKIAAQNVHHEIMVKSDHFNSDSPRWVMQTAWVDALYLCLCLPFTKCRRQLHAVALSKHDLMHVGYVLCSSLLSFSINSQNNPRTLWCRFVIYLMRPPASSPAC